MGYIFPRNTFLQLKHYIQRIYIKHYFQLLVRKFTKLLMSFFTTQLVCIIVAQTLHTFDKNIPSKCKFSDFPQPELKFIKFLMSFFKQKVSFSSKCGSLLSVMRENSSVLFHLKLYMLSTKGTHQVQIFRLSTARIKINQIPCHFSSHESVVPFSIMTHNSSETF